MTTLLITGTDTGVGKTWVGRALGHALVAAGRRVVAIKPVETGCSDATALLEDGALLAAATGQAEPRAALYRLPGDRGPGPRGGRRRRGDRPRRDAPSPRRR